MPTWTVTRIDDSPWTIARDDVTVDIVRSSYDASEVLEMAEQHAGAGLLWRLTPGGFASVEIPSGLLTLED